MPKQTETLRFQVGSQWMEVTVTDKRSFMGTLRNMRGVRAVSADGTLLSVELSGTRQAQEIINELRRIYISARLLHTPAPLAR